MLDQEDMQYLSDQAQEVYNAYQRRFESEDWKALVEWSDEQAGKAAGRQLTASKWDDILLLRGEMRAYHQISSLEATTENEFLAMVQEAKAKLIAEAEEDFE